MKFRYLALALGGLILPAQGQFPRLPATLFGTVRSNDPGLEGAVIDNPRFEFLVFFQGSQVLRRVALTPNAAGSQNYEVSFSSSGEISVALEQDGVRTGVFALNGDFAAFRPNQASRNRWDFTQGVDSDGDRLPDSWELAQAGVTSLTALDGVGDLDGDGLSNLDEFYAGTDPQDDNSVPRSHVGGANAAGELQLTVQGKRGRLYSVEQSLTLAAGSWTPLMISRPGTTEEAAIVRAASDGELTFMIMPAASTRQFLRVGVR